MITYVFGCHTSQDSTMSMPGPGRDWRQPLRECEAFLDGLRVHVACAAPSEFMELISICREGSACRYQQLDPLITHIVVCFSAAPCIPCPAFLLWPFLKMAAS